jgi:hypothetical protein
MGTGMAKELKKGDRARWKSHDGTAHGHVVARQTRSTRIKGHQVRASEHEPRYIVESGHGGKASHKPGALTKV